MTIAAKREGRRIACPKKNPQKGSNMSENTWLINGYCQLANKTFFFIEEYFERVIPAGRVDAEVYERTREVYSLLEHYREMGDKEVAGKLLEEYLTFAMDYLERGAPWRTRESDRRACRNTILNSVQMIANLTVWLKVLFASEQWPLCPAAKVQEWLLLSEQWQVHSIHSGYELPQIEELSVNSLKKLFSDGLKWSIVE